MIQHELQQQQTNRQSSVLQSYRIIKNFREKIFRVWLKKPAFSRWKPPKYFSKKVQILCRDVQNATHDTSNSRIGHRF